MIDLKERMYESFVNVANVEKEGDLQIDSNILKNPISPDLYQLDSYHSIIAKHSKTLVSEFQREQLEFLKESLNRPK